MLSNLRSPGPQEGNDKGNQGPRHRDGMETNRLRQSGAHGRAQGERQGLKRAVGRRDAHEPRASRTSGKAQCRPKRGAGRGFPPVLCGRCTAPGPAGGHHPWTNIRQKHPGLTAGPCSFIFKPEFTFQNSEIGFLPLRTRGVMIPYTPELHDAFRHLLRDRSTPAGTLRPAGGQTGPQCRAGTTLTDVLCNSKG